MGTRVDSVIACTPHFNSDAEKPWVVQEGIGVISVWMHPESNMTLEDLANLVESFASSQVDQRMVYYSGKVRNATFRGQIIVREQMASHFARDYIRDGEKFNLRFITSVYPKPWFVLCPCFLCCMGSSQNSAADAQAEPKALRQSEYALKP